MQFSDIILIISIISLIAGILSYFFQLIEDNKRRNFFETIYYNEVCKTKSKTKGLYFSSKIFNSLFHILILLYLIPVSLGFNWFESNDAIILLFQIIVILTYGASALVFPQILIYKLHEKLSKIGKFR